MKHLIRTLLIMSLGVAAATIARADTESDYQTNLKTYLTDIDPASESGRDFVHALVDSLYGASKDVYVRRTRAIAQLAKQYPAHVDQLNLAIIDEYHQRFGAQLAAAAKRNIEHQKVGAQSGSLAGLVAFLASPRYMPSGKSQYLVKVMAGALPALGFAGGKEAGAALTDLKLDWPHPATLLALEGEEKLPNAYDEHEYLASVGRFLLGLAVWQAVDPAVTGALRPAINPALNKVSQWMGGPCNRVFGAIGHYSNYVIPTFKRYYAVLRGNKNLPLALTSMMLGQALADPIAATLAPDMHSDSLGRLMDELESARKTFENATGAQKQVAAAELRKAVLDVYKKMPKLGGAVELLKRLPSEQQSEEALSKALYESNERAAQWLQQERVWRTAVATRDQNALLQSLQNGRLVHTELMLAAHAQLLKREGFEQEAATLLRYEAYLTLANRASLEALEQLSPPSPQGVQP